MTPIGYLNDRNTRGIVPDPIRGPLVRNAFELYAEGDCTLDRLTSTINQMGLTNRPSKKYQNKTMPLSRAQYHRLLRNPIYYGPFRYRGELHDGKHEPLISKALFDKVQELVRSKRRNHTRVLKPYIYRKVFRCSECGGVITIETQKGHHYLRCTKKRERCSQPYMREEEISQQATEMLLPLCFPKDWTDWMTAKLAAERSNELASCDSERKVILHGITESDQKIARLTKAYTENVLTLDEFRQTKEEAVHEKAALSELLKKLATNSSRTGSNRRKNS